MTLVERVGEWPAEWQRSCVGGDAIERMNGVPQRVST